MKCPACGTDVLVKGDQKEGTNYYEPEDRHLLSDKGDIKVPFSCDLCGAIDFPFQAVRDVVFVFFKPAPEKIGSIIIPDDDGFRGGSPRERLREPVGIVLSVGPGTLRYPDRAKFMPTEGVLRVGDRIYYNKGVPWKTKVENNKGEEILVAYCGVGDIFCKYSGGEDYGR